MAGWFVLALWVSANSNAVQPSAFDHVRSGEPRLRELIADGYARAPTFRRLVDAVEQRSCIVYVATIVKLSDGMRGALLLWSVGLPEIPVLRVLLRADLSRDEGIAVLAHELQHVVEAVSEAPAGGSVALVAAFDKLDSRAPGLAAHKYETDEAVGVTARVRGELAGPRRDPRRSAEIREPQADGIVTGGAR